jgi:LacI family transcriptional regulator
MPRERFIGLALSHAYSYYRDILRGITRFVEGRSHWRFVRLAPEVDRSVRETLRHVDAAIVDVNSRQWCDVLLKTRARIVNVGNVVPGLPLARVGVENRAIGRMAAEHFLERGLRSFAFVGRRQFLFSIEREEGFRTALAAAGHKLAVYHSHSRSDYDPMASVRLLDRGVSRWLLALTRPAGILTPNDLWGVEVTEACWQVGLRVPEDIAVLGVDDDDLHCAIARPLLSSVIVPAVSIGMKAAELVDRLLNSRRRTLSHDVLLAPPGIAVRRSTDILEIDDPDVVTAIRFIRENCHRRLQVADVLREVPVSRRWLERRVFHALGITLGAEIRRTRLERAKRLLVQTGLPLADVAAQSGFSDLRHLEVTFRHELNKTPTQFRHHLNSN